ncbi:hypothetical protein EAS64_13055 [Trebonia kvetii]|uniref:Uncharacterized protein n=1 Tax=Trebonia kvetii TaxID=2480626 RepID=A0A6P2C251_9ACTN|nr:hypothetical protein EAS64_13055 [Trebonia kvetii]
MPADQAGAAGARHRPPGDHRGDADTAPRRPARLGQRPAGHGADAGVPRPPGRAWRPAAAGARTLRQPSPALAAVQRDPAR